MIFDAQRSIPVRQETYRIHILVCPHAQPNPWGSDHRRWPAARAAGHGAADPVTGT
jgi:hypothetical protein